MKNKKFFKNVMTGVTLTGTGLSHMQAQVNSVVRANGFELPPVVVSWVKAIGKKIMEGETFLIRNSMMDYLERFGFLSKFLV